MGDPRPSPDIFTLLAGLSRTVKEDLAPRAEVPFVRSQLYSLSSILRILATKGRGFARDACDDERDLRDALQRLQQLDAGDAVPPNATTTELRKLLVSLSRRLRAEEQGRDVVRAYLRKDLSRPHVALLDPAPELQAVKTEVNPARPTGDRDGPRRRLLEHLTAQLRERWGDPDLAVHLDAEASAGYSAETRVLRIERGGASDAGQERLALRIQWADLPMARLQQSVGRQALAMRAVEAAGIPVPHVEMAHDDPEGLGAAYLVTKFVEGYVPPPWTADGQEFVRTLRPVRRRFLEELIRLESLDWRTHGLADMLDGQDLIEHHRRRVERWDALSHDVLLRPDPLLEEVLAFLHEQMRPWGEVALVHGDYRPGNIIYDPDTRAMRAIIDWDGVHLGDPHENVGQLMAWAYRDPEGLACGLFEDAELHELYEEISGRQLDPRGTHYYELVMAFRRYLGFSVLARAWVDGGGDLRMARAWLALENDRRELGRLLDLAP